MNYLKFTIILFFLSLINFRSCCNKNNKIENKLSTNVYKVKIDKDKLVEAFAFVESTNNPYAVNKKSGATGYLSIMPICIEEVNRLLGYNKYNLIDRKNKSKSIEIFHIIMQNKNPTYDIRKCCKIWNPNGGLEYYNKVKNRYNELIIAH